MAVLHLMVGLPCSGKTTYARRLAATANALLLTPDAWYLKLFDNDAGHPDHDRKHSQIEAIMLDVARQALMLGCNVILDFGFWAVQEREALRHMALDVYKRQVSGGGEQSPPILYLLTNNCTA